MSQPTAYGGFTHRNRITRPTDEPTDRIRRFRSSQPGLTAYDHSFHRMNSSAGGRFAGLKSVPIV